MKTIVIKKYANRKYYSNGTYIRTKYLLNLIATDQDFMVVDNITKRDITLQSVLSALFLEIKSTNADVSKTFIKDVLHTINNGGTL